MPECPCGSRTGYARCCGPIHDGQRQAVTAEELMRSRYAAFVLGRTDHLYRSWHPRTRPPEVELAEVRWLGLTVIEVVGGGPEDETGTVEFVARYRGGCLRERSRFARRAGRWMYLDAE